MKKIGILTYHHVVNWGSVLQAVCLVKFLERVYPKARVEIIDYVPQTSEKYNNSRKGRRRKRFGIFFFKKNRAFFSRKAQCEQFLMRHATLSEEKLTSDDLSEVESFIKKLQYDAVFVGSDTVFQLGPNMGNVYISAPQAPNAYFLPFEGHFLRVGFAASVNPYKPEFLDALDLRRTTEAITNFDHVFYRDEITYDVLKALGLGEEKMSFMPDPSLLVDFDLFCIDEVVGYPERGLAAVAIGGNGKLANATLRLVDQMGYTPINLLSGKSSEGILNTENIRSIEEIMSLHKRFDLVITDRFHGSILTLVMADCPLIGIEQVERYPVPNSKIRDLYHRVGIAHMLVRVKENEISEQMVSDLIRSWKYSRLEILERLGDLRVSAMKRMEVLSNLSFQEVS